MSLITCPDCGNQVSSRAAACPKCGGPVQASEAPKTVEVTKVDVSFEQTTRAATKWVGALILIAAFIGSLVLLFSRLTDN